MKKNIVQTAFLMAILTLVSKCFGFIREMVMANYFGASYITDAYVIAVAIPNIIFAGVLGSVATAYMPMFSKIAENNGKEYSNKFTSQVINILFAVALVATIVGLLLSDQLTSIFASGFKGETASLCNYYLKITLFYMLFTSTVSVFEAFLQYKGVFLPQIITGYAMNTALIAGIVFSAYFGQYYLAFGGLVAYIIKFIVAAVIATKQGYSYTFTFKVDDNIRNIALLALPVFIGSSISQVNVFVDKTLASGLLPGSVSALNYGNILVGAITGLTISILTTILYPKLSQANATRDIKRFNDILSSGMNLIAIIAFPCFFGALAYSEQIVQIIYERGAFDPAATNLTASAFFYYALGLVFIAINELLIRAYYSMHDIKTPVMYGAIAVLANITLNLILIQFMAHKGLALATSIATMVNSILLYNGLKRKHTDIVVIKSRKKIIKIGISAVIAVGISLVCYNIVENGSIFIGTLISLAITVVIAAIIYLILLRLFKIEEVGMIKMLRVWGKK